MSYIGNDDWFVYAENFCENLSGSRIMSEESVVLGKKVGSLFKRICIGYESENDKIAASAVMAGAGEQNCGIFMLESITVPAFRYALTILNSIGIYVSGNGKRIMFYGSNGFGLTDGQITQLMKLPIPNPEYGSHIKNLSGFDAAYTQFIADTANETKKFKASVSCGNKRLRELWLNFFDGSSEELVFQISDDGTHVNACLKGMGFISYERLLLIYSVMLGREKGRVYLPQKYHYAAEKTGEKYGFEIVRFDPAEDIPAEAASQIFLRDALYMCIRFMKNYGLFMELLLDMPKFSSARREIAIHGELNTDRNVFQRTNGRIFAEKSGRNTLLVLAQAMDSETAAELCGDFCRRFGRKGFCGDFHSEL